MGDAPAPQERLYGPPPGTVLVEILAHGTTYRHYAPFRPAEHVLGPRYLSEVERIATEVAQALSRGLPLPVEWTTSDTDRVVRGSLICVGDPDAVRVIHRDEWGLS